MMKCRQVTLDKVKKLTIDILGFPYKVQFVEELMARFQVCGCANIWGGEIQLDPDVTTLDMFASLFHEILEVMCRKTETKCDHELIGRMETFFMMILINNPELIEMALHAAKTKEGKSLKNRRTKKAKGLVKGGQGKGK